MANQLFRIYSVPLKDDGSKDGESKLCKGYIYNKAHPDVPSEPYQLALAGPLQYRSLKIKDPLHYNLFDAMKAIAVLDNRFGPLEIEHIEEPIRDFKLEILHGDQND